MIELVRHNHVTRDIKAEGKCPACDEWWKYAREQQHTHRWVDNGDGTESCQCREERDVQV